MSGDQLAGGVAIGIGVLVIALGVACAVVLLRAWRRTAPPAPLAEGQRPEQLPFWRTIATFAGLITAGAAVLALLTGCSIVGGYVQKAGEVVSVDNLEEQTSQILEDWEALTAAANNACLAQDATGGGDGAPTLVENPAMAYAATYRSIRADYNARMDNIFEAGIVGPIGYPREIPDYAEAIGAAPDFCSVSNALATLKTTAE